MGQHESNIEVKRETSVVWNDKEETLLIICEHPLYELLKGIRLKGFDKLDSGGFVELLKVYKQIKNLTNKKEERNAEK